LDFVHTPVLLEETLALLGPAIRTDGGAPENAPGKHTVKNLMIDCTLGEGGHSEAFLDRFPDLNIYGTDADKDIIKYAEKRLGRFGGRMKFFHCWAEDFLDSYRAGSCQSDCKTDSGGRFNNRELSLPCIILIDLGVSLYHYEKGDRGFSFQNDEALDMRIDTGRGESVKSLLAHISEKALADLLYRNAEEQRSRRIARAIVRERAKAPVDSSARLASIVESVCPRRGPGKHIHPATKTFQALRVAVNGELDRLPSLLEKALSLLKSGGRLGVISFHSLEDRIVKNFFRDNAKDAVPEKSALRKEYVPIISSMRRVRLITKKPVSASEEERLRNPQSRSAKLRVVEKTEMSAGEDLPPGFPQEEQK